MNPAMRSLCLWLLLLITACASQPVAKAPKKALIPFEDPKLAVLAWPKLERFSGQAEFERYLRRLHRIAEKTYYAGRPNENLVAALDQSEAPSGECTDLEDCPNEQLDSISVTGSRISKSAKSITNNQTSGVDEGDLVKQIGDYLLVLQDGRIFALNTKTMTLTDRINVYRPVADSTRPHHRWENDYEGADWYDEMLILEDHILVTAYSYQESATELSIFRLDQTTGTIERRGVFLISSDDYFDDKNYATRIVGDRLIMYSPFSLNDFDASAKWPVIRKWQSANQRKKAAETHTNPLLDARSIFKPVVATAYPWIHAVSICPLGDFAESQSLNCQATGFIGPRNAEMFVSNDDVYLWNSSKSDVEYWQLPPCNGSLARAPLKDIVPAAVFRVSVKRGTASVVGAAGQTYDQFSMDQNNGQFRALVDATNFRCGADDDAQVAPVYFAVPERAFGQHYEVPVSRHFTSVPTTGTYQLQNRFTENWLVYGGANEWGNSPPDAGELPIQTKAVAVPLADPEQAMVFDLPHSVIRIERVGDNMLLNGYQDDQGLHMSLLSLKASASLQSSLFLKDRFESEGRSHAFNSAPLPKNDYGGTQLMGLPTVQYDAQHRWWTNDASDLSFVIEKADGQLAFAGNLLSLPSDEIKADPSYVREVSCYDWYGNTRPIFTDDRIFGLMGTTLVELRMQSGQVQELKRVDLTKPLVAH